MRKLLLIGTLTFATLAWVQAAASDLGDSQRGGDDLYNQTIASQAHQYRLDVAANSAFEASESGNWSGTLPGSMAAEEQNTGDDLYNQRIAAQSQQYRLGEAAIAAAGGSPRESERWNGPQPDSMAANVG